MRVAIVIDSLARGGAERQAIHAASELARAGCDAELIYYRRVEHSYDELSLGTATRTYLPKDGRYWRFVRMLSRHFRQRRFDVVHGFLSTPTLYACAAAQGARVPVVLGGIRGLYDATGIIPIGHRFVNRFLDGWIVNSQAAARSVVAEVGADPNKVFVVYNGVDTTAFESALTMADAKRRLGIDPSRPVVSIFAVVRPEKNHRLFLRAAAQVRTILPETQFVVAGDGPGRAGLEAYARALGIAPNVSFLGHRKDVAELLAATDVSMLTSNYEGLPNALLEAMGIGKPIVTTAFSGVEELVRDGHNGLIAPLGDHKRLAVHVVALLQDPVVARRLGENGRETVAGRFSMNAMGRNLIAVYQSCLHGAIVCNRDHPRNSDVITSSWPAAPERTAQDGRR